MRRSGAGKSNRRLRAFVYLRLSVDKEDGKAQSIDAQRSAVRAYALLHDIDIVEEFTDSGISGQSARRPAFNTMIAKASDGTGPVDMILMFAIARMARNMRLFFDALGTLEDAGVEVVSITENFGEGRSKRVCQTVTAMMAEQQALDSAIYTRKSRRENARQGYYNGGPVAYGYETFVARQDGEKQRMKLRIVPAEASVVGEIFDWADMGRGGAGLWPP